MSAWSVLHAPALLRWDQSLWMERVGGTTGVCQSTARHGWSRESSRQLFPTDMGGRQYPAGSGACQESIQLIKYYF